MFPLNLCPHVNMCFREMHYICKMKAYIAQQTVIKAGLLTEEKNGIGIVIYNDPDGPHSMTSRYATV